MDTACEALCKTWVRGAEMETTHLQQLEGAKDRLELFQADLTDYQALTTAIGNSEGVFHLHSASSCSPDKIKDPHRMITDPAVQGSLNVLKASLAASVKRVVFTSSMSAMVPNPKWPEGNVVDESCWTDCDHCIEKGIWYPLSTTLKEKAARDFAQETGLDVVFLNPGCVLGRMLQPKLNSSAALVLNLIKGISEVPEAWLGCVHVEDVARAHILLYETPSARGRHLCTEEITHFSDFAEQVDEMYPQYNVQRFKKQTHPGLVRCLNPSRKLIDLGLIFTKIEKAICDTIMSLQDKGFI